MVFIYNFKDYKTYLKSKIESFPGRGRGVKAKMAQALSCHTAHLSQVLRKDSQLTLEQADKLNRFLGHTEEESHFFLLLIQFAKAGTQTLRQYFLKQIEQNQQKQLQVGNRVKADFNIQVEDQFIYYSSWQYLAVHALCAIPKFAHSNAIAEILGIPQTRAAEIIEFLVRHQMLIRVEGELKIGPQSIHIGTDSPMLPQHHNNWHMKCLENIARGDKDDMHYSSVIVLSKKDIPVVKEALLKAIEKVRSTVKESGEEVALCYLVDCFALTK